MIVNKVTKLYFPSGLDETQIQAHLDEQNTEGYYLISVCQISAWYRFFWAKEQE